MKNIKKVLLILAVSIFGSCSDFLDVAPPEQATLKDAVKDAHSTLAFMYSCYGGVINPVGNYSALESSSDEYVLPPLWNEGFHKMTYDISTAASLGHGWRWGDNYYRFIGQCYLFLENLPKAQKITDEERKEWEAEVNFLIAYYHMMALIEYGPCPISESYIDPKTDANKYPGRSHFDYVVDWIVNKFDESAKVLPAKRVDEKWSRATSTIAKALKARLLVYAASPLWNGSFPFPEWKNKVETPGYGYDLVSLKYDPAKWQRAKKACEEALNLALSEGGNSLYVDEELYSREGIALPFVPGVNSNTPDGLAFLKKVMLMRYLSTTRSTEGNKEIIWGIANQGNFVDGSLPHHILTTSNGNNFGRWSGISPVVNTTVEYFYTKNGKRPAHDNTFTNRDDWFKSANISGRTDIINLNVNREPRFYAWLSFDGGDYGSKLRNGSPLKIELRNADKQGYNPSKFNRDNNVTGYFSQKYILPTLNVNMSGSYGGTDQSKPRSIIRLAELYLNLAECEAALGNDNAAINNLNIIRQRAGVPNLTSADLSLQNATDWVRNERFVELWLEGHRYYDIRRWMIAQQTMDKDIRKGLSAYGKMNPSFDEFNTLKPIDQPFRWNNRMYLVPLFHNEVYKNPNLVQAPGY